LEKIPRDIPVTVSTNAAFADGFSAWQKMIDRPTNPPTTTNPTTTAPPITFLLLPEFSITHLLNFSSTTLPVSDLFF
jgi:hypothetical protein